MATTTQKLHHFYARAGFGMRPEFFFDDRSFQDHITMQFESANKILPFDTSLNKLSKKMSKADRSKLRTESKWQSKRWFDRMLAAKETTLVEKMGLFWHGILPCRIILGKTISANYINALRNNALGNYRDLLLDVSKSAAMIRYLNNQQNKKTSPNENFARELLELFTIGRGAYTEQDIKEAARAFTGWSSNLNGEFVFRKPIHDDGEKTFMGQSGYLKGEDIIDIVLQQPETAKNIARKVYAYFVSQEIDEDKVSDLGALFFDSNYNISLLMRTIFESDWFYTEKFINQKIKSPVELLINFCQLTNAEVKGAFSLAGYSRKLGQKLLDPPNVAGWPGGRSWIDNASLALRMNLGMILLQSKKDRKIDIHPNTSKLQGYLAKNSSKPIRDLSVIMFGYDRSGELNIEHSDKDSIDKAIALFASQMEFQMC